jgi:hypothetical protein
VNGANKWPGVDVRFDKTLDPRVAANFVVALLTALDTHVADFRYTFSGCAEYGDIGRVCIFPGHCLRIDVRGYGKDLRPRWETGSDQISRVAAAVIEQTALQPDGALNLPRVDVLRNSPGLVEWSPALVDERVNRVANRVTLINRFLYALGKVTLESLPSEVRDDAQLTKEDHQEPFDRGFAKEILGIVDLSTVGIPDELENIPGKTILAIQVRRACETELRLAQTGQSMHGAVRAARQALTLLDSKRVPLHVVQEGNANVA